MNPILAIIALITLIGCSRREERASKQEACPKGWKDHSVVADQKEIHLCHQDGNRDGVYQKNSDNLGLKIQDRFVTAEDKDFPGFQQKFRLPNFEGLSVKKWTGVYDRIFPQGPSSQDGERFRSLQNSFQEKNISMDRVMTVAEKIPWLNEKSQPATWEKVGPEEKLDALTLVGLLMGIRTEKGSFYQANKGFIDTVLTKISLGRLRLQKQTKLEGQTINALTESVGRERTAGYHVKKNILMLGLPLDTSSLLNSSNYIHELFHFYQDATKLNSNFLETEFSAYAKQGEFVVHSLQEPTFQKIYQGVEDFIASENRRSGDNPNRPSIWGIRYAEARLNNQNEKSEKYKQEILSLIHQIYYFQTDLRQHAVEAFKKSMLVANSILNLSQGEVKIAVEKMENEIRNARELEKSTQQELNDSFKEVEGKEAGALDDSKINELIQRFREVLLLSTHRIQLEECRDLFASGDLKPVQTFVIDLDGPKYLELYRSLDKYQPLKYQASAMDGVD